jgi:type II secretory pathway component PulC
VFSKANIFTSLGAEFDKAPSQKISHLLKIANCLVSFFSFQIYFSIEIFQDSTIYKKSSKSHSSNKILQDFNFQILKNQDFFNVSISTIFLNF